MRCCDGTQYSMLVCFVAHIVVMLRQADAVLFTTGLDDPL